VYSRKKKHVSKMSKKYLANAVLEINAKVCYALPFA
jgi:hypothetical protein